ncbi:MAG: hypothetical protein NUW02_03700 [Candidatus Campbellbacteria bacterium]|nr:hypothetical protein [Candidatus Campbellbacteria bacterium]
MMYGVIRLQKKEVKMNPVSQTFLQDMVIRDHAVRRFKERGRIVGWRPLPGLSVLEEIRFLLLLAEPCWCIPGERRHLRKRRYDWLYGPSTLFLHIGPWRFVAHTRGALFTVELDIPPYGVEVLGGVLGAFLKTSPLFKLEEVARHNAGRHHNNHFFLGGDDVSQ